MENCRRSSTEENFKANDALETGRNALEDQNEVPKKEGWYLECHDVNNRGSLSGGHWSPEIISGPDVRIRILYKWHQRFIWAT